MTTSGDSGAPPCRNKSPPPLPAGSRAAPKQPGRPRGTGPLWLQKGRRLRAVPRLAFTLRLPLQNKGLSVCGGASKWLSL